MSSTGKVNRIPLLNSVSCFACHKCGRVLRGPVQETFNGQGPEAKQPRAEEAKAAEAAVDGCAVGFGRPARAASGTNAHEEEVGSKTFRCRDHLTGHP